MKKILTVFIIIALMTSVFAGCTNETEQPLDSQENDQAAGEEDKNIEEIVLKLGYSTGENDPRGVASQKFKEIVESNTDGRIKIEIYPDGELGADKALISGIINSDVDMTVSSAGNFANYSRVGISAFPFLFTSFEEAWEFMDSEFIKNLNETELEPFNIHVLAHFDNGFRCITTSEEYGPINSVADVSGLKIRTSENQIVQETMSELGAQPYQMDFTEVYEALKNGEFQAQENPVPIIYNSKLYEVQKYLAITNHSYDAMPFVIRNDIWKSLSADDRKIIEDAAYQAQQLDRATVKQQTEEYISLLEEKGMVVTYPDLNEFDNKLENIYDYFNDLYGDELINEIKKLKEGN